ncbi:hypothetical protein DCMF_07440 [Candidatus Formimonas warabiya]|uniref:ABC transporter domain-containing protein n=2 Tax=Formimonas warabiya TaxID=1761012 RepID=A0A3G1L0X8_FORW1|nr:hypothetical protein DCMF_07440 [Candidatus Formimonas warabiya]
MRNISKRFPGVKAVDHVDLVVEKGMIHALLGENGAGKTTLMNILYGLYQPDEGEIFINQQKVHITSPKEAIKHGIGMVQQHYALAGALSVWENIILGVESTKGLLLDQKQVLNQIAEISERYKLAVNPSTPVWQISVGSQQRVEIIKALYRQVGILILDEPTAVLTPQEVDDLFHTLKCFVEQGLTIILITHKLREVLSVADRISVLKDGRIVGTYQRDEVDEQFLSKKMVDRTVTKSFSRESLPAETKPVAEMQNISVLNDKRLKAIKNLSLKVFPGEILGIAGVDGNGQKELAEALIGVRPLTGKIFFNQFDITAISTKERIARGISFVAEDRHKQALALDMGVDENLVLTDINKKKFSSKGWVNWKAVKKHALEMMQDFSIKTPSCKTKARSLSGGNQQKIVLAREITRNPKFLIAVQPTRGLDIGATEVIHKYLMDQRNKGCAILLISTELDEIMCLSDRIAVIFEGEITGQVRIESAKVEEIGYWMTNNWAREVK